MKRYIAQSVFTFLLLALSVPFIVNITIQTGVAKTMWMTIIPIISGVMIFATTCFKGDDEEEFPIRLGFATIATFLIFMCIDIAAVSLNNYTIALGSILSIVTTAMAVFRDES